MKKALLTLALLLISAQALAVEPIDFSRSYALSSAIQAVVSTGQAASSPCQGANPSDCTKRETGEGSTACYGAVGNYCDFAWTWMNFTAHVGTSPLQGSYSFTTSGNNCMSVSLTAADEYYASAIFTIPTTETNDIFNFSLRKADETVLCRARNWQTNVYGSNLGGTDTTDVITNLSTSTWYVKIRAKRGTGANAECQVWMSSNGTTWTSTQTSNNGTWTDQIGNVDFRITASGGKVDDIRVYTGNISY